MAKKKTVKSEPVLTKNISLLDNPDDEKRRALIKWDDANVLTVDYNLKSEKVKVKNNADGKSVEATLGEVVSYVPTLTINFIISEPLAETDVNLLKNTVRLIKRTPAAELQLNSTYATVGPTDESYTADNIVYRYTGSIYIAYADFSNLSNYVVEKSNAVNCTSAAGPTSNINITDQTKDASITYTLSLPTPDPEPDPSNV